ncbi:MAG: DUF996 domain-containing protein [Candidatus Bathyarchaeota archaeon]
MVISPFLVSGFSLVAGLIGLILVLIAVKRLSDHYKEASIFNNSLYGVILSIVGGVVFVAALFVTALSFFTNVLGIELSTAFSDPTAFSNIDWAEAIVFDNLLAHVGALVGSLIMLFIFIVVAAIFYRKSLTTLAEKTGVGLFGTAGLLLLIGAVLTIIAIGFLLIWIAEILLIVAFFRIRAEPT